jgi:hypothetical protein
MKVIRHLKVNIAGLLNNYKGKKINMLCDDDGNLMTDKAARLEIGKLLALGHKYLPTSDCDGFDPFEKGCPGHECEDCPNCGKARMIIYEFGQKGLKKCQNCSDDYTAIFSKNELQEMGVPIPD